MAAWMVDYSASQSVVLLGFPMADRMASRTAAHWDNMTVVSWV